MLSKLITDMLSGDLTIFFPLLCTSVIEPGFDWETK
jgi:hypothetical protein